MRRLSLALVLVLTLSCSDGGTTGPKVEPVASVTVTPPTGSVEVGQTLQLTATAKDATGNVLTGRTVTWSSGNQSVATVNNSGLVTAVDEGTATITATCEGMSGSALVTTVPIPVASVEVSPSTDTMDIGDTLQLTATPRDAAGHELAGRTVTWSSSVESVATVSEDGLVTGLAAGTAAISAMSEGRIGSALVRVLGLWATVSAGGNYTCGVTIEGEAYCWGNGEDGALGNGSRAQKPFPTLVSGGLTWASVSAGPMHTCGVTTGGEVYCWGYGGYGALGNGSGEDKLVPTLVSGGHTFASVTVSVFHTCGVTTSREAYCWGGGAWGALGTGSSSDEYTPALVLGGPIWVSADAEGLITCGVTTEGEAYCWGDGEDGTLGNGSTERKFAPSLVLGGLRWESVSVAGAYICGVTTEGEAYCWGDNSSGRLGTGSEGDVVLVPALVAGDLTWENVAANGTHTCGVTVEGEAYCWGSGYGGILGNGSAWSRSVPTLVSGQLHWASVSAAWGHTCGVSKEREAYCWGFGETGQLGTGSWENEYVPKMVVWGG